MHASDLRSKYKSMTVLPDPDWPPAVASGKTFTNLVLIEQERNSLTNAKEATSMANDYAHGKIDSITARKQQVQINDVFNPILDDEGKNRLTILVDGAPGVGKTTLTRKICQDWANSLLLHEYQLVILVPLRTATKKRKLLDILLGDNLKLKEEVVQQIHETSGENILFILDGFDELSTSEDSSHEEFLEIIKGESLHSASVLVTSRPYASKYNSILRMQRVNRHVEIRGFNPRQIQNFMKESMELNNAICLIKQLQYRLDVASLCYIPLNCKIVAYVYRQQKFNLPTTLTELYEVFILHTLRHHTDKNEETEFLADLPEPVKQKLDNLCNLAFQGLMDDKLVFSRREVDDSEALSLGLMTSITSFTEKGFEKQCYQFLHLTIQEFLAARHVESSKMPSKQILTLFVAKLHNHRFRMMLIFLAGQTRLSFLQSEFSLGSNKLDLSKGYHQKQFLFLAQLLYECGATKVNIDPLNAFLSNLDNFSMERYLLSTFDCTVLANFFSLCEHSWQVMDFTKCRLRDSSLQILSSDPFNKGRRNQILTARRLNLEKNTLSIEGIAFFFNPTRNEKPVKPRKEFEDSVCLDAVLLFEAIQLNKKLLHIQITAGTYLTRYILKDGDKRLKICPKALLSILNFMNPQKYGLGIYLDNQPEMFVDCSRCKVSGQEAVTRLCQFIKKTKRGCELGLSNCNLPVEFAKHIITAMSEASSQSLKPFTIDFNKNGLTLETMQECLLLLPRHSTLKVFNLQFQINSEYVLSLRSSSGKPVYPECLLILKSLETNSQIKGIDLQEFPSRRVSAGRLVTLGSVLKDILKTNNAIEVLKLPIPTHYSLTASDLNDLADSISTYRALKKLELYTPPFDWLNRFITEEVIEVEIPSLVDSIGGSIKQVLSENKTLQNMELHIEAYLPGQVHYVCAGLRCNSALETLTLKSSALSESSEVCIELFEALQCNQTLQSLDISNNALHRNHCCEVGETLIKTFKCNKTLRILNLKKCGIDDFLGSYLAKAFRCNTTLSELNIGENPAITDECWCEIFSGIKDKLHLSLTTLDISKSSIRNRGSFELARMLTANCTLTRLVASDCNLTDEFLLTMSSSLKSNPDLRVKTLDISRNKEIKLESSWIQFFSAMKDNSSIQTLVVTGNSFHCRDDSPHQRSLPRDYRTVCEAIGQMIASNSSLIHLYMNDCELSVDTTCPDLNIAQNTTLETLEIDRIVAVLKSLKHNTSIRRLVITTNHYCIRNTCNMSEVTLAVADMLSHNQTIKYCEIRGEPNFLFEHAKSLAQALYSSHSLQKFVYSGFHTKFDKCLYQKILMKIEMEEEANEDLIDWFAQLQIIERISF